MPRTTAASDAKLLADHHLAVFGGRVIHDARAPVDDVTLARLARRLAGPIPKRQPGGAPQERRQAGCLRPQGRVRGARSAGRRARPGRRLASIAARLRRLLLREAPDPNRRRLPLPVRAQLGQLAILV